MKIIEENKEEYTVIDTFREARDVVTLKLIGSNGKIDSFVPGQFITVYFPEFNTPEGKSYSISSLPYEKTLNITVKAIGQFSNKLCSMNKGDKILISKPYGFFFSENENMDMVIFTGGIGVVPFRGMINQALSVGKKVFINLSNRTRENIVFKKEFEKLKENENFKINYYLTREEVSNSMIKGRINIKKFIEKNPHNSNTEYFICGSISFVRDLWKELKENGISEDCIYTEAFFSH